MSINRNKTSKPVASLAGETLSDNNASAIARSLAASALAQAGTGKQTSASLERLASRALDNEQSADAIKRLAGSVLSQANKQRR